MAMRPGDSAPKFDQIEQHLNPDADSPDQNSPPPEDAAAADLPDSHVFQMPAMVPHFSDGSTDVLERGRDHDEPDQDATEPLFPRQTPVPGDDGAADTVAQDDESTAELKRITAREMARLPAPDVADPSPGSEETVVTPAAEPALVTAAASRSRTPAASSATGTGSSSKLLTLVLISYASAVTIGLIYVLMNRGAGGVDRHQLEDLRDPVDEEGTVRIYQRDAELPPGHQLKLTESQRYGNILVEPLRVTQGPIQFEHYSRDKRKKQAPSEPVYKLWLKLTNVSKDQQIAPFDALLMYKRELNREGELVSNTFLRQREDDAAKAVVFSYPAAQNSEWDMQGQELGRTLNPGESIETFIPSDTDRLDTMSGELVWRFHLRKGYAPSGRGVTTLVEVAFSSSEVKAEAAVQDGEAEKKGSGKQTAAGRPAGFRPLAG